MRFSAARPLADTDLLVHVHIPHAGGTSLRRLLGQALGQAPLLLAHPGELEGKTAQDLEQARWVSGPVGHGAHHRFATRKPAYVTVLRHPVDRYVSAYAACLADDGSPHHEAASRHDIDDFLRRALDGDDPALRQLLDNPQCRMVCGEADHRRAQAILDDQYYLAGPLTEIDSLARMLLSALGRRPLALPRAWATPARAALPADRLRLSERSVEALMEASREDVLLYSDVQKTFACVREAFEPSSGRLQASAVSASVVANPPAELRFMGETDDVFISNADYLSHQVLRLHERFARRAPERLLDIGCGYGRLAYGLRRRDFGGSYAGFDILARHVAWLVANFPGEGQRYRFDHADLYNERYNPQGRKGDALPLPYAPASFDCLASLSVFTHLYEDEAVRYVHQLAQLLQDGGVWITTFFCLPADAAWQEAPQGAVFPLVSKVSAHAYVHSLEEPLYVIAFEEEFLQRLFAREGLEVVSQRKGRWFSKDAAIELQDWFVLRKRAGWAPPAPLAAAAVRGQCNICGSSEFGPGPNGRLAPNGALPRCMGCDSLERHRVVRRVFQALPPEFLAERRALQFSPDSSLDARWFRRFELSVFEGENSLDMQAIARGDASYDFLSSSHVLESVPDDRKAFDELCRILSPRGLMHISFGGWFMGRQETIELSQPVNSWGTLRYYGRNLVQRFGCAEKGLHVLEVQGVDPGTGMFDVLHLFTRDEGDAARLRGWLSSESSITVS